MDLTQFPAFLHRAKARADGTRLSKWVRQQIRIVTCSPSERDVNSVDKFRCGEIVANFRFRAA